MVTKFLTYFIFPG